MADFIALHGQDMWKQPTAYRVIPVNTVGAMGAGLALDAAKRIPGLEQAYKQHCRDGFALGTLFCYRTDHCTYLCFPSKGHWRDKATLEHVVTGLMALADFMHDEVARLLGNEMIDFQRLSIAIPPVGTGLGHVGNGQNTLNTQVVRRLIRLHLAHVRHLSVILY